MTGGLQVPERYLLPEAVGSLVPNRVAALMFSRTNLGELRNAVRGIDPEVDAVLMSLHIAALRWRASVGASDDGSESRKATEAAPQSEWMNTREVADELGVTDSRIRQECREGRIEAENVGRPNGWRIRREDFEHYRAARAQEAAG